MPVRPLLVAPVGAALIGLSPRDVRGAVALRRLGIASSAAAILVLLVTQSRTALVAAWMILLVACIRFRPRTVWRVLVVTAFLVGAAAGSFWLQPDGPNVDGLVASGQLDVDLRARIWRYGAAGLSQSPWFGIGLNQFHLSSPGPEVIPHAHNMFLQVALDLGLVGLIAYLSLQALLLMRADRASRGPVPLAARMAAGGGMSLIGVHLYGLTDAVALGARVGWFQWFAAGLILAAWRLQATAERQRDASERPLEQSTTS